MTVCIYDINCNAVKTIPESNNDRRKSCIKTKPTSKFQVFELTLKYLSQLQDPRVDSKLKSSSRLSNIQDKVSSKILHDSLSNDVFESNSLLKCSGPKHSRQARKQGLLKPVGRPSIPKYKPFCFILACCFVWFRLGTDIKHHPQSLYRDEARISL